MIEIIRDERGVKSARFSLEGKRIHRKTYRGPWRVGYWIHPSLNEWATKTHFIEQGRIKRPWIDEVVKRSRGMPRFGSWPVIVTVTTFLDRDVACDIDNYVPKFILDGLVQGGVIADDSRRIVVELRLRMRLDSERPRTEVEIARADEAMVEAVSDRLALTSGAAGE